MSELFQQHRHIVQGVYERTPLTKQATSVMKFGGTSVGSGARICQVAAIIAQAAREALKTPTAPFPVVVVSAMAGVTDQLVRLNHYACSGKFEVCAVEIEQLKQQYVRVVAEVVREEEQYTVLLRELMETLEALERDVKALQRSTEEGQDVALHTATVVSYGERLSVLLVAAALTDLGVAAEAIRQEVIITAHPQSVGVQPLGSIVGTEPLAQETREQTHKLLWPVVRRGAVPVVAGFIGRTVTGEVTTLGRNGSDYSAAVLGAALDCEEVAIYTDVDGILTADPRLIANASLLASLSYEEATHLSWMGAKVLHPHTLQPLLQSNIPVRVRNTFQPHLPGTVVGSVAPGMSGARALVIRHHMALMTLENIDPLNTSEYVEEVLALITRAAVDPIVICTSSERHISFVIDEQEVDAVLALLARETYCWEVRCHHDVAVCACIGSGFITDPMSSVRAVAALDQECIPLIAQGSSVLGLLFVVANDDSEQALRNLHRELIEPEHACCTLRLSTYGTRTSIEKEGMIAKKWPEQECLTQNQEMH